MPNHPGKYDQPALGIRLESLSQISTRQTEELQFFILVLVTHSGPPEETHQSPNDSLASSSIDTPPKLHHLTAKPTTLTAAPNLRDVQTSVTAAQTRVQLQPQARRPAVNSSHRSFLAELAAALSCNNSPRSVTACVRACLRAEAQTRPHEGK